MYTIERYSKLHYDIWNEFVRSSKNGTFLFHRDFMEYHSDRFEDYSLMVFKKQKLVAMLPGNIQEGTLYSHQGLTYGGLVLGEKINYDEVKIIFSNILEYLLSHNILELFIKFIPIIYNKTPSFESESIMYEYNAKMLNQKMNLAIDFTKHFTISKSKMKHFRRIDKLGLKIKKDNDFSLFWNEVLIPRLETKHKAKPVHSLGEIQLLHKKFPENIIQYNVYDENKIIAGITLFKFPNGVKSQYGATTDDGEKVRALDYLFISLIEKFKNTMSFFDMGVVNDGESYNPGLLKQKEELGCSLFIQNTYTIHTEKI